MSLDALTGSRAWILAGWTMLHFLWVGAGLGVLGAVVRRMGRHASPERRYALALVCFGAVAFAPVGIAAILNGHIEPDSRILDDGGLGRLEVAPASPIVRRPSLTEVVQPVPVVASTASRWDAGRLAAWLPWVWVLGAPATFALLATGLVGAERLRRGSRVLTEGVWFEKVRELCGALGIARHVALAVCDRVVSPTLVGVVRPLILLPASALSGWTPEEVELALLHELAHVRRHDNLVNLVQRLVESALFFHPAVWIASGWVRLEREHCCDRLVVSRTGLARPYAELLATLASASALSRMSPSAAMAEAPVVDRIRQILNLPSNEDPRMPIAPSVLVLCATLFLTPAAIVVAQAVQKPPAPKVDTPAIDRDKLNVLIARVRQSFKDTERADDRAYALGKIAQAQAIVGDRDAARKTFREAMGVAQGIKFDEQKYYPHISHWISKMEFEVGLREDAIADLRTLFAVVAAREMRPEDNLTEQAYEDLKRTSEAMGDREGVAMAEAGLKRIGEWKKEPPSPLAVAFDPLHQFLKEGDLEGALTFARTHDFENLLASGDGKLLAFDDYPPMRTRLLMSIVDAVKSDNRKGAEAVLDAILSEVGVPPAKEHLGVIMPRLNYLASIASAYTRIGRYDDAMKVAGMIASDTSGHTMPAATIAMLGGTRIFQAGGAFADVAEARMAAGDLKGAMESARKGIAVATVPGFEGNKETPRGRLIAVLADAGAVDEAYRAAAACEPFGRPNALWIVANSQRRAGDEAGANRTLRSAIDEIRRQLRTYPADDKGRERDRLPRMSRSQLLRSAADYQALVGDLAGARETAGQIEDVRERREAFRMMARARASVGDLDGAMALAGEVGTPAQQAEMLASLLAEIPRAKAAR